MFMPAPAHVTLHWPALLTRCSSLDAMHEHGMRTVWAHSQIEFNDPGAGQYRSLYLGTLGAEARCKPRPHTAGPSFSCNHAVEGYVHGTLSTAGIAGASPAIYSITRRAAKQRDMLAASGSATHSAADQTAAAAGCVPSKATEASDPGMQPKVRVPVHVNKPNLIYCTLDIEGAQPLARNVPKRPRNTNPLSPSYKLASGAVFLPSGPAPADRLLCDPLKVADIPGATRSPRRARSATAPRQLDVTDIEGASSSWQPTHRQHNNLQSHNFILDVSDINTYMARFRAGPRPAADKGHPEGPKVPQHVKPRQNACDMDNSLRTLDIEGSRRIPAKHQLCAARCLNISVSDIEGAAPAAREKMRLSESRKAAAAAAVADQHAGQAVLSGLVLEPAELAAVWTKCTKLDKDNSGLLTASELESSLKSAKIQLSPGDTQRLLAALKDNAGLLNYRKLAKHLKGRVSRPNSAQYQPKEQRESTVTEQLIAAVAAEEMQPPKIVKHELQPQAGHKQAISRSNCGGSNVIRCARPCTAPATSQQESCQGPHWPAGKAGNSHWFAGVGHDEASAADLNAWSPTRALELTLENAVLFKQEAYGCPAESAAAPAGTGTTDRAAGQIATDVGPTESSADGGGKGLDVVPGWVIGADPVHGTFKVVQPFGHARAAVCTNAAAGVEAASAARAASLPAVTRQTESAAFQTSNDSSPTPMEEALCSTEPAAAGPCDCSNQSSRYTRPASACFSSSTSSIVACDLGLTVASTNASNSSIVRSELFGATANIIEAAQTGAQSRQKQQQRPRSAAAAVQHVMKRVSNKSNGTSSSGTFMGAAVIGSLAATTQGGSSSALGLADRRRLQEGMQQDLAAVRLLQ